MLMKFPSSAAPEVVKMTTSGAANDATFINMMTVGFSGDTWYLFILNPMMQQPDVLSHTIGFVLKVNVFFALAHLYILRGKISYALPLLLDFGIKSQFTQV